MSTEQRLLRLERNNRFMRRTFLCLALTLLVAWCVGAKHAGPKTAKFEALEIVNQEGTPLAYLGPNGGEGASLVFYDEKRRVLAEMRAYVKPKARAQLLLRDPQMPANANVKVYLGLEAGDRRGRCIIKDAKGGVIMETPSTATRLGAKGRFAWRTERFQDGDLSVQELTLGTSRVCLTFYPDGRLKAEERHSGDRLTFGRYYSDAGVLERSVGGPPPTFDLLLQ